MWAMHVWVSTAAAKALTCVTTASLTCLAVGIRSAVGLQDGVSEERAPGQGVVGRWGKMWCPRALDGLRFMLRVSWGDEFEGRVLNGAFHRERQQSRDDVHPALGRVREERGAYEGRNRVRPYHFWGEFGVFLSHWSLRWVFGTRGVHRMVSAATR